MVFGAAIDLERPPNEFLVRQGLELLSFDATTDEQIYEIVTRHFLSLSGVRDTWIVRYEPGEGILKRVAGTGLYAAGRPGGPILTECRPGEGATGLAFETRQVQVVEGYASWPERFRELPPMGYSIACPIILPGEEVPFGVFACCGEETSPPPGLDVHLAQYSQMLGLAIKNLRLREELRRESESRCYLMQSTARLEAIGLFSATLAHDVRNALLAIQGHAELLAMRLRGTAAESGASASIEAILNAGRTTAQLCEDLLGLARRSDASALCSATEALHRMERLIRPIVGRAGGTLRMECRCDEHTLLPLRESELMQILANLVTNAVDAARRETPLAVSIRLKECVHSYERWRTEVLSSLPRRVYPVLEPPPGSDAEESRFVVLEVEDNGTGIARENAQKIFDPLFTTKLKGTGLGLASVYRIVEGVAGGLMFETEPGRTMFRLCLPVGSMSSKADKAQPLSVMVVEDDAYQRECISEALAMRGIAVQAFESPLDALAAFKPGRFNLVISDLIMNGMDGLELLTKVGELDSTAGKVLMSGYVDGDVLCEAAKRNILVMAKPFGIEDLMRMVQSFQ